MTKPESSNPAGPCPEASLPLQAVSEPLSEIAAGHPAADDQPASPAEPQAAIEIAARGVTDQGRVRKNNEDSLSACDLSQGQVITGPFAFERGMGALGMLFVVADGMGGQACGELASGLCSEMLPARVVASARQFGQMGPAELGSSLEEAFIATNRSILEASRSRPGCHGMGTTATAAALCGPYLLVAQVGDSRAYLLRNGNLVQLTRDQTFLNYLLDMGAVEATAPISEDPRRSILVQAMGTAEEIHMVLTGVELRQRDRLLMCCDGLYSMVRPELLFEIVSRDGDLGECCRALIDAANQNGGNDNITAIMVEFSGTGLQPCDPAGEVQVEAITFED
ncbi:MAG TPA: protein phosphatase 2C domain-containing protein [Terriglobia bacterium]|nr:protein phosphatase 2C domain-containing protein [Terriglobia bacterium]